VEPAASHPRQGQKARFLHISSVIPRVPKIFNSAQGGGFYGVKKNYPQA
jgi:hypothetical protein